MTIRDGMSAKLKRITSAFQKMERAARSADKATQAVNPLVGHWKTARL